MYVGGTVFGAFTMNNAIDRKKITSILIDCSENKFPYHFNNYIELHLLYLRQKPLQTDMSTAIEPQLAKMIPGTMVLCTVSLLLISNQACTALIYHSEMRQRSVFLLGSNKRN